ncbi:glutamine amidotransferase [Pseudonocardia sediminis]|uniref:Gamma-glutamyl-hercynylcysteine sulfoxide hydrolase n=1 Tax=Pseudonocardia sediminis TaxID=1397368 RepID=A0A4Q7UYU7_PSEST|nr:ergothioneine biosynthesis protein EgtC [Pseudonocardia sediminis]RZT86268.1 glutamine amidotransferase [Pseudonocardia sediminis]
MCRHLAWLGPPRTVASVLLEPAHGLLEQAYAPADMRGGGTINVDGFGAGWYPPLAAPGGDGHAVIDPDAPPQAVREGSHGDDRAAPVRIRSDQPIWSDTSFAAVASSTLATGVLGAVRSASPGMPVVSTAAAPFAEDRWLFSLNGMVRDWPGSLAGLAATLPTLDLITLDAPTDAAVLWALVRHRLRAGHDPATILTDTVLAAESAAPGSRLNLLLTDGTTIWGTAWRHALAVHTDEVSVTVASEPTDPLPSWTQVPDGHLVVARPGHHDLHPLAEHHRDRATAR